jgi:PIN domain
MTADVVLVDYENIQPTTDWKLLKKEDCIIKVFLGTNQKSTPIEMSQALQPLGTRAEYVLLQHAGKNALDFLLTFHLGQLVAAHSGARFWIVSRDLGFDSLIKHLQNMNISCARVGSVSEIYAVNTPALAQESHVKKAIDHLRKLNGTRPRRSTTLRSTIRNLIKEIDEAGLEALVTVLQDREILTEVDGKVSYSFPTA